MRLSRLFNIAAQSDSLRQWINPDRQPLTVDAPIVIDARSDEDADTFLRYCAGLKTNDAPAIAEQEAERLEPYFGLMADYFRDHATVAERQVSAQQKLSDSGYLSAVFRGVSAATGSVILSDVVILPNDVASQSSKLKALFKDSKSLGFAMHYQGRAVAFDFLRVDRTKMGARKNSTAFAILKLDAQMMRAVPETPLRAMLKDLQSIMSIVNHDPLHHLTLPYVNPRITGNAAFREQGSDWGNRFNLYGYEAWAHIEHERILMNDPQKRAEFFLAKHARNYLKKLSELRVLDGPVARGVAQEEMVDYFGTVLLHELTRLLPLTHPLMTASIDSLRQMDSGAAASVEAARAGKRVFLEIGETTKAVNAYALSGIGVVPMPDDDDKTYYTKLKYCDLINISFEDVYNHAPKVPTGDGQSATRAQADSMTLDWAALIERVPRLQTAVMQATLQQPGLP